MKSPGVDPKSYGTAQGYSEDYGMKETNLQPVVPEGEYQNGSQASAVPGAAGGGPMNPFTQQQYQQSATNPFKR